ncbi:MAG: lysoplasmalogenase [Erysipelotrichaceae bacterium]|nr:lysoplasmalogenase [Erysipelotrichaceae bacterium]
MKYFFIVIFWIATIIHLIASSKKDTKLRNYSKPFIIPSLIGMYIFSTDHVLWSTIIALIFSWIGDLFLVGKGVKWFSIGGISFMISHLFFIISYSYEIAFKEIDFLYFIALFSFYLVFVTFIFNELKPFLPDKLLIPMFFYLSINGLMNCFSILRLYTNMNMPNFLTFVGATLFFISDSILFFVRFNKNSRFKTHFWVMLTYSLAEFLIVFGLI